MPRGTSRSSASTTRASKPSKGRPKARVSIARGSRLSAKMRPVSVMPHTSIMGKPKRFSKAACSCGSMPAPMPKRTSCRRSAGLGGWFRSMGATTPR